MKFYFSIIIIILFCAQNAIAQEMRSVTGVECAEADYKIKIGDVFFDANKTGYVCSGNLPVVVSIYSKKTNSPITAKDVVWLGKIDSSYGAIYEAKLTLSHFDLKDVMEITMSFTESGKKETISKFKISKDIKVIALKSNNAGDYFDDVKYGDNYIKEYWPSHTPAKERPWVFVPPGGSQATNLSVRNKSNKNAGKEAFQVMKVQTSGGGSSISPSTFIGDDSNFNIGQSIPTSGSYPFVGSCSKDTIAYIYSQAGKSYGIDVKLLAFTHDDIQVNLGNVPSDTSICVGVGNDGYYTSAFRRSSKNELLGPTYINTKDSIVSVPGNIYVLKIVAGKDKKCNTVVPSHYIHFSSQQNVAAIIQDCNSVYNQIGVSFSQSTFDTLYIPDFREQNSFIDGDELYDIKTKINVVPSNPDNIIVYLTDAIISSSQSSGTTVTGKATQNGEPSVAITPIGDGFTLAHEIGHGKFWLRHPDNDSNHLLPSLKEGESAPGMGPYNIEDKENFMYHSSIGRVNRIRHYQWKKILTGRYGN